MNIEFLQAIMPTTEIGKQADSASPRPVVIMRTQSGVTHRGFAELMGTPVRGLLRVLCVAVEYEGTTDYVSIPHIESVVVSVDQHEG